MPRDFNVFPTITFAAIFARGTPVDLLTNGTVLDALGFTSKTYTVSFFTANCIFKRPLTFNSFDMLWVYFFMVSMISSLKVCGGRTHAESPECTPDRKS